MKMHRKDLQVHTQITKEMLARRFIAMRFKNAEKTVRQINQFYIQKAVDEVAGNGWVD
jgi:hypothetical protein